MPILDYCANIHSDRVILLPVWEERKFFDSTRPESNEQKQLSKKSMTRIRNSVDLLIGCSKRKWVYSLKDKKKFSFKVAFMTLTLPSKQIHSDSETHYKVFAPFIRRLKKHYDLSEYIWKAEAQDNGNIHWHLTLNVFIHHRDVKKEWNSLLQKAGYSFKTEGHANATTQIKATKSIKNLAGYLCGYLSKKDIYKKKGKDFIKGNWRKNTERTDLPDDFFIVGGAFRKRYITCKLWNNANHMKKKKCFAPYLFRVNTELLRDLVNASYSEYHKDFFSIWKMDFKKFIKGEHSGALWKDFIDGTKQHGKQAKKYYVESLN